MLKTLFVVTHALSVILRSRGTVPLACVTEMNCRDGLGESLTRFREFFLLTSVIAYRYFGSPESGDRFSITHGRQHVNDKQTINAS